MNNHQNAIFHQLDNFIKDYPFEVIDSKYGEDEKDERTTLYVPAYNTVTDSFP
jgi:hypothetical protein